MRSCTARYIDEENEPFRALDLACKADEQAVNDQVMKYVEAGGSEHTSIALAFEYRNCGEG